MKSRIGISLVAMMALVGANTAQANAIISWGPVTAVNYGLDSQILGTAGGFTYVEAVTAYNPIDLTINGVTFLHRVGVNTPTASQTYSGATHISQAIPSASNNDLDNNTTGQNMPINTDLGDDYHRLLGTYGLLSQIGDGAITLAGLNVGTSYRVQLWAGVWDNRAFDTTYDTVSLHPGYYVQAPYNPPQFVVGTFTADAMSQIIPILAGTGTEGGLAGVRFYAGAISLFEAGGQPVPEPGTWLLLGGSLLGLCVGGFKRIRSKLNV